MSDGDRSTDPASLPAMAAAIHRIEAHAEKAADYSMRAYALARRSSYLPITSIAIALLALAVACAGLR